MMTFHSTVRVPTSNGSRYLQQLCKHWRHNLTGEFTGAQGTVIFPPNARGADWLGGAPLVMSRRSKARSHAISTASPFARRRSASTGKMQAPPSGLQTALATGGRLTTMELQPYKSAHAREMAMTAGLGKEAAA